MRDNEYLLIQGNIFSPSINNHNFSWNSEILIYNNKIISIASKGFAQKYYDLDISKIRVLKIPSKCLILPGFIDSHMHPIAGSLQKLNCSLSKAKSWMQGSRIILEYFSRNNELEWLFASGYEDSWFEPYKNKTPLELLDELPIDKPVTITRFDGHAFWCNSLAIKMAGIDANSKNPVGGIIGKCKDNETLDGLFHDESMKLIRRAFPKLTKERLKLAYEKISNKMIRKGITSFADASTKEIYYETYLDSAGNEQKNSKKKKVSFKPKPIIYMSWKDYKQNEWNTCSSEEKIRKFEENREIDKMNNLNINTIKIFVDGVLESGSAAVKINYLNSQENKGLLHYNENQLKEIIHLAAKYNYNLHYHVVGDEAFRLISSCITQSSLGGSSNRHVLAHVQMVDPVDLPLPKNVSLCFSPLWFYRDFSYAATSKELGFQRCQHLYPINYFKQNTIGIGSDWPVSSMNPFKSIEVAITHLPLGSRQNSKNYFSIDHKISLLEALTYYTIGSAKICGEDNNIGSLEVGKQADLIVIDRNLFEIKDIGSIHKTKVLITMIKGKIVYNKLFSC